MKFVERLKISIFVIFLPLFMLLLLGPTEIYYSNITDFTFLYKDFIGFFIIAFFTLLILGSVVIALLPDKIYKLIIAIISIFSFTAYIQNMLFNTNIATRDGSMMNWESLKTTIVINTFIWCVLLIVLFILVYIRKWKTVASEKICLYISVFLILIQMVAFISIVIRIEADGDNNDMYILEASGQFEVASEKNIIILCIDSADSETMYKLYSDNPDRYMYLNDFTLYTNYDSGYSPTFPSVTHLLTGTDPDGKGTQLEYNEAAWSSDRAIDFFGIIHESGYSVNVYTSFQKYVLGNIELLADKFDNVEYTTPNVNRNNKLLAIMLEKMSMYRYAPYIMKPALEVNMSHYVEATVYTEDDYDEGNYALYTGILNKGLSVNTDMNKALIYQHMRGLHRPYDINAQGEEIWESEYDKEDAYMGAMLYVEKYLENLKKLGVYDDATIIILADHSQEYQAPMMSLFLIKKANESHDTMNVCTAPICSDDFQATILDILDQDYSEYGTSIYDWSDEDVRTRWNYYRYQGLFGFEYTGDGESMAEEYKDGYDFVYDNIEW